jgi:L-fuculose-phosphate aldolase
MKHQKLRAHLIETALRMNAVGLNRGRAGNLSARVGGGFLITPGGMAYDAMRPADIVEMTADGAVTGRRAPSSEWRIHRDIYGARAEAGAVVHAHPMFATTLACLGRPIPAFHYMVAVAGGRDIRCAPYATFGTAKLSVNALGALKDRKACLLANHGIVALGTGLADALDLACEVEWLAAQYWRALQIGKPRILPAKEIARVLKKFEGYGQASAPAKPRKPRKPRKTRKT